jgi:hypothetical protein
VDAILEHGLDRMPFGDGEPARSEPLVHENVRGPRYYQ